MTEKTMIEPMLISSMRKQPNGIVRADHSGGGAIGTSVPGFLHEYDQAIGEARAEAWDEAMATARQILARRSPQHYETDIDLIVEENPYRDERGSDSNE